MRRSLQCIHQMRAWFSHVAATMRYYNRQNMAAIGITEQEVLDFLKARLQEINAGVEPPDDEALSIPPLDSLSLTSYSKYDSIINGTAK